MKTVYSCGDSYLSLDYPKKEITSFLEQYCQDRGFRHVSLARAGATCFAIRLQIELAIKQSADYVVVGCTSSDRLDIAVNQVDPWIQLKDILYSGYRSQSELNVKSDYVQVISDTVYNLVNGKHEQILTSNQRLAIKQYVAELHNMSLKRQENYFVISDGLRKLIALNIPFVYIPHGLAHMDWSWVPQVWPLDKLPCQMPNGPYDYVRSITHNDQSCHNEYLKILKDLTQLWD